MKKILIIKFLIIYYIFTPLLSQEKKIKFIAVGHIYPIMSDQKKLDSLIDKINTYNAEYVFILGDSKINEKRYYDKFIRKINSKTYFTPGNHELINNRKKDFFSNVGYFYKVIEDKNLKFLLINSSDNKKEIYNFLEKNLSNEFNGLTILLTHHRIWDDTKLDYGPNKHDKDFYFDEIYQLIKDKVNIIIAGDSKRPYFRDLIDDKSVYGKQNVNLIYWLDKIGSIDLYSVGMGDGTPKAGFIVAEYNNGQIYIKGDFSSIESYDVLPKHLINTQELRYNLMNTKAIRELVKPKYFLINKVKFIILTIILIILAFIIFILKKKKEKNENKN